ncbi:MAG: hypothetical protein HY751_07530 [Nitrospinae bacterium]|nr:hypothetical protein [Nitrospinota bacterium]
MTLAGAGLTRVRFAFFAVIAAFMAGCSGGGSSGGGAVDSGVTLSLVETVSMASGATSGIYTVDAPSGEGSLTIIADGGDTADMDISNLTDPSGFRMVSEDPNAFPIGVNLAQGYGQSAVAFTVPHSGDYSFTPGQWQFQITHYASPDGAPRDVSIYTIVKNGPGTVINVNVWLVAMSDYAGSSDPNLTVMLDEFKRILAGAGFTVGDVQIKELTGSQAERLTLMDMTTDANNNDWPDDMDELFRLSSQAGNDYMNLFLVRHMSGGGILGMAGGIPGPQLIQGTAHSGVAVNMMGGLTRMTEAHLLLQGATMAHELGHFLGLFHPTESDGAQFDPISDTPECPASQYDSDHDGQVTAEECQQAGGDNLMFWAAASFTQEQVSGMQRKVISLNPAVR